MKALVNTGLNIASKSLNSASQKENSSASLIRMVGSDACFQLDHCLLVHMLKISQEDSQCLSVTRKITDHLFLPVSHTKPVNNVTIFLLLLLFLCLCGEQYYCQIMRTVRLITMDYTSFKPLIVHVSCLIQVRSVIYQIIVNIFHYNVQFYYLFTYYYEMKNTLY